MLWRRLSDAGHGRRIRRVVQGHVERDPGGGAAARRPCRSSSWGTALLPLLLLLLLSLSLLQLLLLQLLLL